MGKPAGVCQRRHNEGSKGGLPPSSLEILRQASTEIARLKSVNTIKATAQLLSVIGFCTSVNTPRLRIIGREASHRAAAEPPNLGSERTSLGDTGMGPQDSAPGRISNATPLSVVICEVEEEKRNKMRNEMKRLLDWR